MLDAKRMVFVFFVEVAVFLLSLSRTESSLEDRFLYGVSESLT